MSRRPVVTRVGMGAVAAAAVAVCPMVLAAPVQTVFSVENALYGAGYDVGKADGWIDADLRAAVERYQASRQDLSVTGELDETTLSSLGIASEGTSLMAGNMVASKQAAMDTLGLTPGKVSSSSNASSKSQVASVATPKKTERKKVEVKKAEPKPEPAQKQVIVAKPSEQSIEKSIDKEEAPSLEKRVSQPAPIVEVATTPELPKKPVAAAPVKKAEMAPAVSAAVVAPVQPAPAAEPKPKVAQVSVEPDSQPITVASLGTRSMSAAEVAETDQNDVEAMLPQEPTAAGLEQPEQQTTADLNEKPEESTGNAFTRVLNFLFGWMV